MKRLVGVFALVCSLSRAAQITTPEVNIIGRETILSYDSGGVPVFTGSGDGHLIGLDTDFLLIYTFTARSWSVSEFRYGAYNRSNVSFGESKMLVLNSNTGYLTGWIPETGDTLRIPLHSEYFSHTSYGGSMPVEEKIWSDGPPQTEPGSDVPEPASISVCALGIVVGLVSGARVRRGERLP